MTAGSSAKSNVQGSHVTPAEQAAMRTIVSIVRRLGPEQAELKDLVENLAGKLLQQSTSDEWVPDWATLTQAAHRLQYNERTIRRWCEQYGIGHKPAGRWLVDMNRVRAWQTNENYPPLQPV